MATKRSTKKKPAKVVTERERQMKAEHQSLMRANKLQRKTKTLAKQLRRAANETSDELLDLARAIASNAGWEVKPAAPVAQSAVNE